MTKQEPTIDLLKSYIRKCEESLESTTDYALISALVRRIELLRYAIECIEKQIPKKPIVRNYADWSGCECGMKIYETFRYCPYCGQAIDWSDNE